MTDLDIPHLDELAPFWDEIREDYQDSRNDRYDQAVRDCVALLAADPGGASAPIWTLGLVLMAPYLTWLPGEGLVSPAMAALEATDTALRDRPCAHTSHPYLRHDSEGDEYLAEQVVALADDTAEWEEDRPRDEWLCPRNVAGFARIARDIIEPGSADAIPPRLPMEAAGRIDTLAALLHGYPKPWTDIDDEISSQARNLSLAEPEDRAGHLMVVRAVAWYAVSGMVRTKSVLDDLVEALEEALPHFAGAECGHAWHPALPATGPAAAELGIMLSSRGGRGVYEGTREEDEASLEHVTCPVLMAETGEESLKLLRERRELLFGDRDTSHADAEYLRADGRLDIEKITERLDDKSWNEPYADDLGLWAARRYEGADARERPVLLLTAWQATKISYPDPPASVVRDILATLRAVAAAPRPERCGHEDEHPALRYGEFRAGLPHFYAPQEYPPAGEPLSAESWMCPRFAGTVAEEGLRALERLAAKDG
ncbi:hypothetical protein [Streptomyces sp. ITFR-16]|uniref:hypothetical protein n=1 Tax=Streptomyces sp. ITFR-16 TaxID=3075198 RepID=UPI00288BF625|nr:hypothetical protein [Streptomyces sp. ITFR-16]WNI26573.1 hypothetical protein RLT58_33885 [Streptomyces sp. ITFR-16]